MSRKSKIRKIEKHDEEGSRKTEIALDILVNRMVCKEYEKKRKARDGRTCDKGNGNWEAWRRRRREGANNVEIPVKKIIYQKQRKKY